MLWARRRPRLSHRPANIYLRGSERITDMPRISVTEHRGVRSPCLIGKLFASEWHWTSIRQSGSSRHNLLLSARSSYPRPQVFSQKPASCTRSALNVSRRVETWSDSRRLSSALEVMLSWANGNCGRRNDTEDNVMLAGAFGIWRNIADKYVCTWIMTGFIPRVAFKWIEGRPTMYTGWGKSADSEDAVNSTTIICT